MIWKQTIIGYCKSHHNKLIKSIIYHIEADRDGRSIEVDHIRKCADSFGNIDFILVDLITNDDDPLQLYIEEFEFPLSKATKEYYNLESINYIRALSISNFIEMVFLL